jgi:hypothetical protein
METVRQQNLIELWSEAHSVAPVLRGAALLKDTEPCLPVAELASLSLGQRDRRLLALRRSWFEDQVAAVAECPECSSALDLEFRLSDLRFPPANEEAKGPLQISKDGYEVAFRLPTSEDLTWVSRSMKLDEAVFALLRRCVFSCLRGGSVAAVGELPESVVKAIADRMAEADPQGDINLQLACPVCAHRWDAAFDIAAFLWLEVDGFARRRLAEVHELASAYGWAENEILSMPSARKDFYLRMIRG